VGQRYGIFGTTLPAHPVVEKHGICGTALSVNPAVEITRDLWGNIIRKSGGQEKRGICSWSRFMQKQNFLIQFCLCYFKLQTQMQSRT
jgi:hypothetical protein